MKLLERLNIPAIVGFDMVKGGMQHCQVSKDYWSKLNGFDKM